jgi:alkylation response protein AidB-like acyl-CoA dehydrogenase
VDLRLSIEQIAFRDELRAWLTSNHPGPVPNDRDEAFAFRQAWQSRLHEGGYAGLTWPAEYGGRAATIYEQAIFNEEAARVGITRPADVVGLQMVGPAIMHHGSPEQKGRFLEPLLSAQEFWCQGFSEPDAGSDLAALKTRAVREGDAWRVTGQKIWTSMAHVADWCILLARTDPEARQHRGLTLFLMDMRSPGIELRPLRQATGDFEFNEMFLDDVPIPADRVLGGAGNGWNVALTVLMNERAGLAFAFSLEVQRDLADLITACRERGLLDDDVVRDGLARLHIDAQNLRLSGLQGLAAGAAGRQPGPEGSLGKLRWTEVAQDLAAFAVDVLGPTATSVESSWSYNFIRSRGNSIEGGTSEIQAGIVAERVLGLPRAGR